MYTSPSFFLLIRLACWAIVSIEKSELLARSIMSWVGSDFGSGVGSGAGFWGISSAIGWTTTELIWDVSGSCGSATGVGSGGATGWIGTGLIGAEVGTLPGVGRFAVGVRFGEIGATGVAENWPGVTVTWLAEVMFGRADSGSLNLLIVAPAVLSERELSIAWRIWATSSSWRLSVLFWRVWEIL